MKRNIFNFLFLTLFIALLGNFNTLFAADEYSKQNKEVFVQRLYHTILQREPDKQGLDYWVNTIGDKIDAKSITDFFIHSDEFQDKNLSDEDFIKTAFVSLTETSPSNDEIKEWEEKIKESKEELIKALLQSEDFEILSKSILEPQNTQKEEYIAKIIEKLPKDEKGFYNADGYQGYMLQNLGVTFFDVRTDVEHEKNHPKNSILIPVYNEVNGIRVLNEDFVKEVKEFTKENLQKPLIVMCAHGHRSKTAAELLTEEGFENVINLTGGFSDKKESWEMLNLPQESNITQEEI